MLGEFQALALIVAPALAIETGRPLCQGLIDEPGHNLSVLEQKGCIMGPDLKDAL
jgi:hypothetical protein